ncbi:MAG: hypothetical protein LBG65_00425 [Puniceicoccales bacterium]|jgi:polyhydroxyalkanoate synthesis regulator phasin|nr:hypothetical protein [Puniceicoccales bacterium]
MFDTLKKTLFAGLGAAVITKETVENALHEWIEKGKVSKEEAGHFAEKLVKTGGELWEKTRSDAAEKVGECLKKAPFAHADTIGALEARISALEQALIRTQATPPPQVPDAAAAPPPAGAGAAKA